MKRTPLSRKAPLRSKGALKRRTKVKNANRRRRQKEWTRAYGSPERVEWTKCQPCAVCGMPRCDVAHVETGGMGRKADAALTIPLCRYHHDQLHRYGVETFERAHDLNLHRAAESTHRAWCAVSGESGDA